MLREALAAFRNKDFDNALKKLTNVAHSSDKTLLMAMVLSEQGELNSATELLEKGILEFQNHDGLLLQLCQLRKRHNQHQAFMFFFEAHHLQVRTQELAQSYLALLIELELLSKALQLDSQLTGKLKEKSGYIWYRAELYRQLGKIDEAIEILVRGIKHYPNDFHLSYRLANCYQEVGQPNLAIELYEKLYTSSPNSPELNYALACAQYSIEDYTQTKHYLDRTLEVAPNYVPAHESYSKLMWALDDKKHFLTSYKQSRLKAGMHPQVVHSEVGQLLRINELEQAKQLSEQAQKMFGHIPEIQHMHSIVLDKTGSTEQAMAILRELSQKHPYHSRINLDLANHYLVKNEPKAASNLLLKPLEVDPDNQELWAYQSIAWRLLGDDRFAWLNNYDKIIGQFELPTPPGFNSLNSFLEELKATLEQLHAKERNQPLDQSVRFGTQTDGHLLHQRNVLIGKFRQSFDLCLRSYLSSLPKDDEHPLYRRNTGHFKANGSWSVKLEQGGFHTNHIHPRGWISGPTYINIPQEMSASDPRRSGWLKLGETCLELGERENVDLAICPTPGLLVFFPSYIWHGTYPLHNSGIRMTIPCDISPIK